MATQNIKNKEIFQYDGVDNITDDGFEIIIIIIIIMSIYTPHISHGLMVVYISLRVRSDVSI